MMKTDRWGVSWKERNGASSVWKEKRAEAKAIKLRPGDRTTYRTDVRTWVEQEEHPTKRLTSAHVADGMVVLIQAGEAS